MSIRAKTRSAPASGSKVPGVEQNEKFSRYAHPPRPSPCLDNLVAGWLGGWIVVWVGSLVARLLGGSVAVLLGWVVR